jgi:hypothetical protein
MTKRLLNLLTAFVGQENNIWSVNDYALRDLLVFLVQKYRIDEVYDSKVKAQNWEKLIEVHLDTSTYTLSCRNRKKLEI